MNSRLSALKILSRVINKKIHLDEAISTQLDKEPRSNAQDNAFCKALCFGVCRYYFSLSELAAGLLHKPFKAKYEDLNIILLIGLWQLKHSGTAPHAAINETVNLTRLTNYRWATKVVNAALRNYLRNKDSFEMRTESGCYDHPQWLIDKLKLQRPQHWQHLLKANQCQPPLTLRINRMLCSKENYLALLTDQKIEYSEIEGANDGVQLTNAVKTSEIPGFEKGLVSVQDAAAQLAADLIDLKPKLTILDACAAPGGKSAHILERMKNNVVLTAIEINPDRCEILQQTLTRLNLRAEIINADVAATSQWGQSKSFDRILVDTPCSGSGVIRRHPDIKILRQPRQLDSLQITQYNLLDKLWPLLKPGGVLVYATCSILSEENDFIVGKFLDQCSDAQSLPISIPFLNQTKWGAEVLTGTNGMDGFYYAVIKKGE